VAAGADGLSLVNTIRGLSIDAATMRPRLALSVGGYSGPALKPIALACVSACAAAVDVPIVGMGGVWSGLDALELVAAGASAVALGTVLFADPGAPGRIRAELEAEAAAHGLAIRKSAGATPLSR
jgi:dihydroorotate dehydrogenase (NAD+) catalytic subunit